MVKKYHNKVLFISQLGLGNNVILVKDEMESCIYNLRISGIGFIQELHNLQFPLFYFYSSVSQTSDE